MPVSLLDLFKKAADTYRTMENEKTFSWSTAKSGIFAEIVSKLEESARFDLAIESLENKPAINTEGSKSQNIMKILKCVCQVQEDVSTAVSAYEAITQLSQVYLRELEKSYFTSAFHPKYKEFVETAQQFIKEFSAKHIQSMSLLIVDDADVLRVTDNELWRARERAQAAEKKIQELERALQKTQAETHHNTHHNNHAHNRHGIWRPKKIETLHEAVVREAKSKHNPHFSWSDEEQTARRSNKKM